MKRNFLSISIIILAICITLILFLNIKIYLNKKKNEKFLETYNNIFIKQDLTYSDNFVLPKIEMDGIDYIGVINILSDNLLIPIESKCNNSFIDIKSVCNYSDENFIIIGTNLSDSFNYYKRYDVDDEIIFINNLGSAFQYKIKNIKRINKFNDIKKYNEDLIIVIKDYYSLEYILFICELD